MLRFWARWCFNWIYSSTLYLGHVGQRDCLSHWLYGWGNCRRPPRNVIAGSLSPSSRRTPWQAPFTFLCLDCVAFHKFTFYACC
jgi:hypothetical protein